MNKLKRKAIQAKTRHEFMAEIMKWYQTYIRRYPVIRTWTKADVYAFYQNANRPANWPPNKPLGRIA